MQSKIKKAKGGSASDGFACVYVAVENMMTHTAEPGAIICLLCALCEFKYEDECKETGKPADVVVCDCLGKR